MPDTLTAGTRLYLNSEGQVYSHVGVDLATGSSVSGTYIGVVAPRGRIQLDYVGVTTAVKLFEQRTVRRTCWDLILEDALEASDPVYVGACKRSSK